MKDRRSLPRHCKGCSHPTICHTHGCAAEEARRNKAAKGLPPRIEVTEAMLSRFLTWRLPQDFAPDGGISFTPVNHLNHWPTGTNLLTYPQARAMLEHVLGVDIDAAAGGAACGCRIGECESKPQGCRMAADIEAGVR